MPSEKRSVILDGVSRTPQHHKRTYQTDIRYSGHIHSTLPKMGEYNNGHHQTRSQGLPAYSDIDTATGGEPRQRELGRPGALYSISL